MFITKFCRTTLLENEYFEGETEKEHNVDTKDK
jgi:hypothetical protein